MESCDSASSHEGESEFSRPKEILPPQIRELWRTKFPDSVFGVACGQLMDTTNGSGDFILHSQLLVLTSNTFNIFSIRFLIFRSFLFSFLS